MINLGKWRWPVLLGVLCGVLAGLFQFGLVRLNFEAEAQLAYQGNLKQLPAVNGARVERGSTNRRVRLIGQGTTPSKALYSTQAAVVLLTQHSLDQKKNAIQQKISALKNRQAILSGGLAALEQRRQKATQGSRRAWTPAMTDRLGQARARYRALKAYPTHTDIPILAQEIKSLEAMQRGQVKIDKSYITQLARQVAEARMGLSLVSGQMLSLEQAAKKLQSDWTIVKPAIAPRWPQSVPGWPVAAGSASAALVITYFLLKGRRSGEMAATGIDRMAKIELKLADDETGALPDDPLTRQASALYERWLALAQVLYAIGPEAPKDIYSGAEPLYKETVAFLADGQEALTRFLARTVIPGDLLSHVTRTVLMALMGACEAGASAAHQQGMTFAALFHDLAVAPRPADAWHEIGSEVGRLSSSLLRKIPGIPHPLLAMVEEILVAMDEYPQATWQNVQHRPDVASFAKLLGHIDRFDKVLQKQKTRLTRRLAAS